MEIKTTHMTQTHDLVVHVIIICVLFYLAIAIHFLTLKNQKHETQKRQKRQPKKVLHSKSRWDQTVIDLDQNPLHNKTQDAEDTADEYFKTIKQNSK